MKLRKELTLLREKVTKEKEKLSKFTEEFIPVAQQFTMNVKVVLDPEEASYLATVEIPLPIDVVCVQSGNTPLAQLSQRSTMSLIFPSQGVPVDLLPVTSNEAILSWYVFGLFFSLTIYWCWNHLQQFAVRQAKR